ncbi:MAG: tetratricopeptide repeat protein [Bacteroidales bacterium]|nr:tetratricopeptide repeat protein [Bacteroidales bacterium]
MEKVKNHSKLIFIVWVCLINVLIYNNSSAFPLSSESKNEIDSLLNALPLAKDNDRFDIFIRLSNHYLSYSMDSSKKYANLALKDAKISENPASLAEVYKVIGNVNYYQGNYNMVIAYYDSSRIIYEKTGDSSGLSKVWNNLGIIYQHIGNFKESIDFHMKSLACKKDLNDSLGIANSLNNIGSVYYDLQDLKKAKEYFEKALQIIEKTDNSESIQSFLNNLGIISQELENYEESLEYFNSSLKIGEKNNNQKGIADTYHNIGKSYLLLEQYNTSLDYYFKALEIYDKLGLKNSQTLNNIGQLYIELDYYKQSLKYLYRALENAKTNNQFKNLRDICKNMAIAYERLKIYDKAYAYYVDFNYYDDSLKNQIYSSTLEKNNNQHEIEKNHEYLEKTNLESQLELEKKDSDIRRRNYVIYSFIAGIVSVLIFAIILFRLFRQKARANVLLKQQNEEILRSDKVIKKINIALTENEEMLRSVFDASPYSILVMDSDSTILDCNNATLKMFHTTHKRDIIEQSIEVLFPPDQFTKAQEEFSRAFNNEVVNKSQYILVKKDGSAFHAEITGGMITDSSGSSKAYVIIIIDITERLDFIENLKQAKLEAEESDRLKTAFLANMSHEIRTPMNSIVGFSNLLTEPGIQQPKKEEYLHHILRSSNSLINLIDDIIDISKIEAGQLNVNLSMYKIIDLVNDVFYTFKDSNQNPELTFHLNIPPNSDYLKVKTDPLRVRQILTNLVGNASKFTEKGNIEIGYKIKDHNSKQAIEFYVKDTGIGIAEDKLEIIFYRFRQIDESRTRRFGGTGLGLAISKRLVELLGGSLRVESNVNQGSVFYFCLPYEPQEKETVKDVEPFAGSSYNWNGKTILIAEDENSNYELLKAAIYRTNIKIIRAFNGEEAVEIVKKDNTIDLVLMDIRMPKLNGYDATKQIKSFKPDLPVVSITAYAMSEDESKSLNAGCDLYISKPVRPAKLLSLLNDFLETQA